jgi:MraZ protein
MFIGIHSLKLDEAFGMTLPSRYMQPSLHSIFLTHGLDQNLLLLTEDSFNNLLDHLNGTSISDPLARLLNRVLLGNAVQMTVDNQGGVELPAESRGYAGIEREAILVGQGDYAELWSPEQWEKQVQEINNPLSNSDRFEKFNISLA